MINPVAVKFNPGIKDTLEGALKKVHAHIDGSYSEVLGDYQCITCANDAIYWINNVLRADKYKYVVVDIETSALYPREGYVLGIALTMDTHKAVYIDSECIDEEVENKLQELFDSKSVIFHNAKFDMKWLGYHFNFVFPKWHDTMLQHYLLNENEAHDLKTLVMKYTKMGEYDYELEEYKRNYMKAHGLRKDEFSYEVIPTEIMYKYAGADADGTMRLFQKFNPIIQKHYKWLYDNIMLRGTQFLMEIEETGVPFNKEYLEEANQIFANEIFELNERLYDFMEVHEVEKEQGVKFNPNSTVQLRKLFFDYVQLILQKY